MAQDVSGADEPYRLYEVSADGHIAMPPRELMFGSDEEAIAYARARLDGKVIDIWQLKRLVAHLDPHNLKP